MSGDAGRARTADEAGGSGMGAPSPGHTAAGGVVHRALGLLVATGLLREVATSRSTPCPERSEMVARRRSWGDHEARARRCACRLAPSVARPGPQRAAGHRPSAWQKLVASALSVVAVAGVCMVATPAANVVVPVHLPKVHLTSGGVSGPSPDYQTAETFGGGSPVEHCTTCDISSIAQGPQGQSVQPGQDVNPATGDFSTSNTLFSLPGQSGPVDLTLTYDAALGQQQAQNALPYREFGYGWEFSSDLYLSNGNPYLTETQTTTQINNSNPITVHEEDGAAVTFTQLAGKDGCPSGTASTEGEYPDFQKYTVPGSSQGFCADGRVDAQFGTFATGDVLYEQGGKEADIFDVYGRAIGIGNLYNVATADAAGAPLANDNGKPNYTNISFGYYMTPGSGNNCPAAWATGGYTCTEEYDNASGVRWAAYKIDSFGFVEAVTTSAGGAYTFTYDANHDLAQVTDPDGASWQYIYATQGAANVPITGTPPGTSSSGVTPFQHEMTGIVNPDGGTSWIGYSDPALASPVTNTPDAVVTAQSDESDANVATYGYSPMTCAAPDYGCLDSGARTTTVGYPDGEVDTDYYFDGQLAGDYFGAGSPGTSTNLAWQFNIVNSLNGSSTETITNSFNGTYVVDTDPVGDITSVTDPNGYVTTNYYNDSGGDNLDELCWVANPGVAIPESSSCNNPPAGSTHYAYDQYGNMVTSTDPLGNTTTNGYDQRGNLCWSAQPGVAIPGSSSCTSPPPGSTADTYDSDGDLTKVVAATGTPAAATTTYSYDASSGQLATEVPPDGNASSNPAAYQTSYTYDGAGRTTATTTPTGTTTYGYDPSGNVIVETDPTGVTTNAYDVDGRLCNTYRGAPGTAPAVLSCSAYYPGGTWTQYEKDTMAPTSVEDPNGDSTVYFYGSPEPGDPSGDTTDPVFRTNPTAIWQGSGSAFTQTFLAYDALGNVCAEGPTALGGTPGEASGGACTSWTSGDTLSIVNAFDNVTEQIDASGNRTAYLYGDAAFPDEPTSVTTPTGTSTATYDADGRVLQTTDPSGTASSTAYSAAGLPCWTAVGNYPTNCAEGSSISGPGDVVYGYNAANERTSMVNDAGTVQQATSTYTYDPSGNLLSEVDDNGNSTTFAYNAAGEETCVSYAGGSCANAQSTSNKTVTYDYSAAGQLVSSTDWRGNTISYGYTADGNSNLSSVTYPTSTSESIGLQYDSDSNLRTESFSGSVVGSQKETWQANAEELVGSATSSLDGSSSTYGYDSHGQLTSGTNPGTPGNSPDTYSVAPNGQLEADTPPGEAPISYRYNSGEELTQLQNPNNGTTSSYGYNADGERCWSAPVSSTSSSCGSAPAGATSYGWNALGEMCWSGQTAAATSSCSSAPAGTTTYHYDGDGLRTSETLPGAPAAGPGPWTGADVDSSAALDAESCPSATACFAVDSNGNLLSSANPTGGASAWSSTDIDASTGIDAISCPTASLCVAADSSGNVLTSTNPTGGASAWSALNDGTSSPITGVSCASATLCVIVTAAGNEAYSTDPTGGPSAWSGGDIDGSVALSSVSCPSTTLCVAVNADGDVAYSTNPTGGASTWSGFAVDGTTQMESVSCPSTSLCVATDAAGDVLTSTNPTGGASAWTATDIDGSTAINAVSCESATACIATDAAGDVLMSTNPTGGASAWTAQDVDGSRSLTSVSCPSANLCIAGDAVGSVWSDALPFGAAATSPVTQKFTWNTSSSTPTLLSDGTNYYVYGPLMFGGTAPIEQINATTGVVTYLASSPSGVQLEFDESGKLLNKSSYSIYGVQKNTSTPATPFGFQGGYTDPSGLIYYINRYYDPQTSQFLSVDPAVLQTGEPYAFDGANPINATDPMGLFWGWSSVVHFYHHVVHAFHRVVHAFEAVAHYLRKHWKAAVAVVAVVVVAVVVGVATLGVGDVAIAAAAAEAAAEVAAEAATEAAIAAATEAASTVAGEGISAAVLDAAGEGSLEATAESGAEGGAEEIEAEAATVESHAADAVDEASDSSADDSSGDSETCPAESFTPTTLVTMANGTQEPISQVKVGDKILATDTKSGKIEVQTVTATNIHHDDDLMDVYVQTVNGVSVIHATDLHPFWDQTTGAWTLAENLHSGDQLRTDDGSVATVAKTVQLGGARNMWDLTVANDHDFYVSVGAGSQTAVLVHNCGGDAPPDGSSMSANDALDAGQEWLGEGYSEPVEGSGRFVSEDGSRVFRMGDNDITGAHGRGPHVNFEQLGENPATGRMMVTSNSHVYLMDP